NGTGAFEMVEAEPGKHALLRAVDYHWSGGPYLEEARFVDLGENGADAVAALAARRVDLLRSVGLGDLDAIGQMPHVKLRETPSAATAVARMKVDEPPFSDPRVRKALRLAIDCERVLAAS